MVGGTVACGCGENDPVLVDVVQLAEPDKRREVRVFPAKVGLYLIDELPALGGDSSSNGERELVAIPIMPWLVPDREHGIDVGGRCQGVGKVVETGTGGVGCVADKHAYVIGRRLDVRRYKDVLLSIKLLVRHQGVGMRFLVLPDGFTQAAALFVSPLGLAEHALKPFVVVWEGHGPGTEGPGTDAVDANGSQDPSADPEGRLP